MALCAFNKVFTIKAFEIGLIFTTFFFCTPAFAAPASSLKHLGGIEARLQNPCDYRGKLRHSRSAKEKPLDKQFRIYRNEYLNKSLPKIRELYDFPITLDVKLNINLSTMALRNKKKNYEALQMYIKTFDMLAKHDNVHTTGNFSLTKRKEIFGNLTNDSIRLLCVMYDEQKKHPKLSKKVKKLDQQLKVPTDFTMLYTQDHLVLHVFDTFFRSLDKVISNRRNKNKNHKNKNNKNKNQQNGGAAKKMTKKSPVEKVKKRNFQAAS